ncbi:MAG: S-layer homology domain-containing protein [Clostridiales bacterium]|jgi:hypothetical protein|nr:S-layer homology domain-containing protein [Clostridiales bacterium]
MKRFAQMAAAQLLAAIILLATASSIFAASENIDIATLNDGTHGSGWAFSEKTLTFSSPGYYTLTTSKRTNNHVVVNSTDVNITLDNVDILTSSTNPFKIEHGKDAAITLNGNNILVSEAALFAGISVSSDATRTGPATNAATISIKGDGSLTAVGGNRAAGIGGNFHESAGNITIDGGTITAQGLTDAAGIGGGFFRIASNIVINGGIVTAIGGSNASDIGLGQYKTLTDYYGKITINGGTIIAATARDNSRKGIESGTIIINGGSVKTNGVKTKDNAYPTNGSSAKVHENALTIGVPHIEDDICVTDAQIGTLSPSYGIKDVKTMDGGKVYFWLPASSEKEAISVTTDGSTYEYKKTYKREANDNNEQTLRPAHKIALSVENEHIFPSADYYGYETLNDLTVTVTNVGYLETGELSVSVTGKDAGDFDASETTLPGIAPEDSTASFTVRHIEGLSIGTHTATVTVSGANDISASFDISFTVQNPKPVEVSGITATKRYDGNAAFSNDRINVTNAIIDGNIDGSDLFLVKDGVAGDLLSYGADAGTTGVLNYTGMFSLGGPAANNYALSKHPTVAATIEQADAPNSVEQTYYVVERYAHDYRFEDLSALLPSVAGDFGAISYAVSNVLNADGVLSSVPDIGPAYSPLALDVAHVDGVGKKAAISLTISSLNYEDFAADITVETTAKSPVTISGVTVKGGVYNGRPYAYDGTPVFKSNLDNLLVPNEDPVILYYSTDNGGYFSADPPTNAGEYTLSISYPDDDPVYAGSQKYPFEITKKPVIVKADDKTVKQGETLPGLTITYSGFISPDDEFSAIERWAVPRYSVENADSAGSFVINFETEAILNDNNSANYKLSHENGALHITGIHCDVTAIYEPPGAKINNTNIEASVERAKSSVAVNVAVSPGAQWALYRDETCRHAFEDNKAPLSEGENTAYIKVTSEDGESFKIYTMRITQKKITEAGSYSPPMGGAAGGSHFGEKSDPSAPVAKPTVNDPTLIETSANAKIYLPEDFSKESERNIVIGVGGGFVTLPKGRTLAIRKNTSITLNEDAPFGYTAVSKPAFLDVRATDWFYNDVMFAYAHNLLDEASVGEFRPNAAISRGALVYMCVKGIYGADVSQIARSSFNDVDAWRYYAPYIEWARAAGIVVGVGDNRFDPDSPVSRQDMATILQNYAALAEKSVISAKTGRKEFHDEKDLAPYAKEAVETLRNGDIAIGKPGGIFDPKSPATRAEAAAMTHRLLANIQTLRTNDNGFHTKL